MAKVLSNTELANIADEFGTPVYVYDADKIKEQYSKLTTAFRNTDTVFFLRLQSIN